jgi:hypothetical protein
MLVEVFPIHSHNLLFKEAIDSDPNIRNSLGNGIPTGQLMLRNYDSDTSIFADVRGNLNENSFNEQILDRNKLFTTSIRIIPGAQ